MNIFLRILYILPVIVSLKEDIKYYRLCKFCKYYVKPIMKDQMYIGDYFGKCSKFMTIDYNSNELKYKIAIHSRMVDYDCGLEGKYFEPISNITGQQ
jgi:hypothetical protein